MRLLRVESFLYFFPMCATCEYNILLFWFTENILDEKSITDCPTT